MSLLSAVGGRTWKQRFHSSRLGKITCLTCVYVSCAWCVYHESLCEGFTFLIIVTSHVWHVYICIMHAYGMYMYATRKQRSHALSILVKSDAWPVRIFIMYVHGACMYATWRPRLRFPCLISFRHHVWSVCTYMCGHMNMRSSFSLWIFLIKNLKNVHKCSRRNDVHGR